MPLVFTFLAVTVTAAALLASTAVIVQPYLYGRTVERLPLRSFAAGLLIAAFATFWAFVNTRATPPDKYGVVYEFNPTARTDVAEFDAVRVLAIKGPDGKPREQTVSFRRVPGTEPPEFVEAANPTRKFRQRSPDYMTVAVLVPVGPSGEKVRFDAPLKDGAYDPQNDGYREAGGSRYIDSGAYPTPVHTPNRGAVVGALLLNLLAFGVWFVALWLILQYSSALSLGLAAAGGLFMLLVAMPILFQSNQMPAAPPAAAAGAK